MGLPKPRRRRSANVLFMTTIAGVITMRKLTALFAIALVSCLSAYAAHSIHTQLVQSTPADGSVSDKTPAAFVFEFSEGRYDSTRHSSKRTATRQGRSAMCHPPTRKL